MPLMGGVLRRLIPTLVVLNHLLACLLWWAGAYTPPRYGST